MRLPARRAGRVTAAVTAAAALVLPLTAPGAAATDYRYWSYWHAGGDAGQARSAWHYADVGPGGRTPEDGTVEGWRFVVSRADTKSSPPRRAPDFAAICGDTAAHSGQKRVAVVVDYGLAGDAAGGEQPPQPRTACARVPEAATGADVLAAATRPRFDKDALVCALDGYPSSGCGDAVGSGDSGAGASAWSRPGTRGRGGSDPGAPVGLIVGSGLVAAVGGAAVWRTRRAGRT